MKKFLLSVLSLLCVTGAFADAPFLCSIEFEYLYKDNKTIWNAYENGISDKAYTSYLMCENNTLGEKTAMVASLATYFMLLDDAGQDYFDANTEYFKNAVLEKYQAESMEDKNVPNRYKFLFALMEQYDPDWTCYVDYERFTELAKMMPGSLSVQSVKVIALGYHIVYHDEDELIGLYETQYLKPYERTWEKLTPDVQEGVFERTSKYQEFF